MKTNLHQLLLLCTFFVRNASSCMLRSITRWWEKEDRTNTIRNIRLWALLMGPVYGISNFTNSCHVLAVHVPMYIRTYSNLHTFSQQGVEAAVRVAKKILQRRTNNADIGTRSIMQYSNRKIRWLPTTSLPAKVCKACKGTDHVRRSSKRCLKYLPKHPVALQLVDKNQQPE